MKMNKKGMSGLSAGALALVVLIFVVTIGANMVSTVQSTQTANSIAANISSTGLTAMKTFGDYFSIIALVIIAAVVIGLLMSAFRGAGVQ